MSESSYQPETLAVHAGTARSQFGEHSEALFLTSSFVFDNAAHGEEEKNSIYPSTTNWTTIEDWAEYERRYPYMPSRIIDNLLKKGAKVSVTNWDKIAEDLNKLKLLIDLTYNDRSSCDYDLSQPMRRANS